MAKPSPQKRRPTGDASLKPSAFNWKLLLQALAIVAAGLFIYWPSLDGGWLSDDYLLVANNSDLLSLHGLGRLWFAAPTTDYWPLTWTLLWIEWQLWGAEPLGYHLCSFALHIADGFLIWHLFNRPGLRWGWLGGLLFVIHPLSVESVAWISEIKNTLSLLFFLLSIHAWLDGEEKKSWGYPLSIFYYLAAMLAKTSTVILPLTLLLYCWWKRGRITRREILRTTPYIAIALVLGIVTIYFQNHGPNSTPVELGGVVTRSIGAGTALFFYLGKFFLPVDLLPIYPRWPLDPPSLLHLLTIPALAGVLVVLWMQRKSWGRHALFGFGFFLLNLLPVLGFVKMKYMTFSWVADHLTYIPIIGLIGLVVAGLESSYARMHSPARPIGAGILAGLVALLAWESHQYARLYINEETLWTYSLQHNPDDWITHNNLGFAYYQDGRMAEALQQYAQSLAIKPDFADAHNNLGIALMQTGSFSKAIEQFKLAVKIEPTFDTARCNLGFALSETGHTAEAMAQYAEVLKSNPDNAKAHFSLGSSLLRTGHVPEAIEHFDLALKINPDDSSTRNNLGTALAQAGRIPEAIEQFQQALKIDPTNVSASNNLARAQYLLNTPRPKN
jgi:Flp pilus assembly protein TadD